MLFEYQPIRGRAQSIGLVSCMRTSHFESELLEYFTKVNTVIRGCNNQWIKEVSKFIPVRPMTQMSRNVTLSPTYRINLVQIL